MRPDTCDSIPRMSLLNQPLPTDPHMPPSHHQISRMSISNMPHLGAPPPHAPSSAPPSPPRPSLGNISVADSMADGQMDLMDLQPGGRYSYTNMGAIDADAYRDGELAAMHMAGGMAYPSPHIGLGADGLYGTGMEHSQAVGAAEQAMLMAGGGDGGWMQQLQQHEQQQRHQQQQQQQQQQEGMMTGLWVGQADGSVQEISMAQAVAAGLVPLMTTGVQHSSSSSSSSATLGSAPPTPSTVLRSMSQQSSSSDGLGNFSMLSSSIESGMELLAAPGAANRHLLRSISLGSSQGGGGYDAGGRRQLLRSISNSSQASVGSRATPNSMVGGLLPGMGSRSVMRSRSMGASGPQNAGGAAQRLLLRSGSQGANSGAAADGAAGAPPRMLLRSSSSNTGGSPAPHGGVGPSMPGFSRSLQRSSSLGATQGSSQQAATALLGSIGSNRLLHRSISASDRSAAAAQQAACAELYAMDSAGKLAGYDDRHDLLTPWNSPASSAPPGTLMEPRASPRHSPYPTFQDDYALPPMGSPAQQAASRFRSASTSQVPDELLLLQAVDNPYLTQVPSPHPSPHPYLLSPLDPSNPSLMTQIPEDHAFDAAMQLRQLQQMPSSAAEQLLQQWSGTDAVSMLQMEADGRAMRRMSAPQLPDDYLMGLSLQEQCRSLSASQIPDDQLLMRAALDQHLAAAAAAAESEAQYIRGASAMHAAQQQQQQHAAQQQHVADVAAVQQHLMQTAMAAGRLPSPKGSTDASQLPPRPPVMYTPQATLAPLQERRAPGSPGVSPPAISTTPPSRSGLPPLSPAMKPLAKAAPSPQHRPPSRSPSDSSDDDGPPDALRAWAKQAGAPEVLRLPAAARSAPASPAAPVLPAADSSSDDDSDDGVPDALSKWAAAAKLPPTVPRLPLPSPAAAAAADAAPDNVVAAAAAQPATAGGAPPAGIKVLRRAQPAAADPPLSPATSRQLAAQAASPQPLQRQPAPLPRAPSPSVSALPSTSAPHHGLPLGHQQRPLAPIPAMPSAPLAARIPDQGPFACEACNMTFNGPVCLLQHHKSRRHMQRAAQAAAAAVTAAAQELTRLSSAPPTPRAPAASAPQPPHNLCEQAVTPELNDVVADVLGKLRMFQERAIARNAVKGASKKLYVCGLREVTKAVKLKKARSVVLAPNIERIESSGGLDDQVGQLMALCAEHNTPVVFALSRKRLGHVYGANKRMSAVAVLDSSGVREQHDRMVVLVGDARALWAEEQRGARAAVAPADDDEDDDCRARGDDQAREAAAEAIDAAAEAAGKAGAPAAPKGEGEGRASDVESDFSFTGSVGGAARPEEGGTDDAEGAQAADAAPHLRADVEAFVPGR